MAKYETQESQAEVVQSLCNFDISRVEASLEIEDPLEGIKFAPGAEEISMNVTVIGKSMVVDGDISTTSPVSIRGTVNGNVTTSSDIGVNGLVNGDISADSIDFNHAAIRGNSVATKEINLSNHSVAIGDITGGKIIVDGKVKGNVTAKDTLFFKSNALMVGSVVAGGINMEDGSRVNASITLTNKALANIDESEFDLEV
ncbi:MAG: polymer-forming cytoskeletal protein [Bacillota bacterium]|nr:polymer-forming cytoskeletal protein [Bacillota bacterium]